EDPLADEPSLAPGQPARLRARDRRVRAAHAGRPGSQLLDAARPEAVQGPLRSGAMRRVGVTAVLVGLAALVSSAPLPEDVARAASRLGPGGGGGWAGAGSRPRSASGRAPAGVASPRAGWSWWRRSTRRRRWAPRRRGPDARTRWPAGSRAGATRLPSSGSPSWASRST